MSTSDFFEHIGLFIEYLALIPILLLQLLLYPDLLEDALILLFAPQKVFVLAL